jgi:PleD family two-component response regulator
LSGQNDHRNLASIGRSQRVVAIVKVFIFSAPVRAKLIGPKFVFRGFVMHILVVEDNPIVADVLGRTLDEAGYFKTTADSIESALFKLKHNQIDAVLLDLNLPDVDGTRLARLIRKNHMPVPILVVSGNSGIVD